MERYEKLFKIGGGTFGQAWLVTSRFSNRNYVLKEVKVTDLTKDELEKTQREAEVLARCKHINIIRYKENFLTGNPLTMCIVMEYADGGDLYEKVKQAKTIQKLISEDTVLHWFVQIIFAVQYLHANNILHRDIKAQNIFITFSNFVKVGDFGIARFLRSKQDLATTAIGTPFYLSPEICTRKPYNHKSDMWAVGCVLYELCALRHPFEAADIQNLIIQILSGVYTSLSPIYSKIVHQITSVLLRTDPERRPTADDILMIPALRPVVQQYINKHERFITKFTNDSRGSPSTPSTPLSPTEQRPMGNQRRNEDGTKNNSPSTLLRWLVRRDSQTQTPPQWKKNKKRYSYESKQRGSEAPTIDCQSSTNAIAQNDCSSTTSTSSTLVSGTSTTLVSSVQCASTLVSGGASALVSGGAAAFVAGGASTLVSGGASASANANRESLEVEYLGRMVKDSLVLNKTYTVINNI